MKHSKSLVPQYQRKSNGINSFPNIKLARYTTILEFSLSLKNVSLFMAVQPILLDYNGNVIITKLMMEIRFDQDRHAPFESAVSACRQAYQWRS